jgi:hypothetical protein
MSQFRKKPVVIEAMQWMGDNLSAIIEFTDGYKPTVDSVHVGRKWEDYEGLVRMQGLKIKTLEGWLNASIGDWIIRGVKGELYPCKPDIFEATYEPASSRPAAVSPKDEKREAYLKRLEESTEDLVQRIKQAEHKGVAVSPKEVGGYTQCDYVVASPEYNIADDPAYWIKALQEANCEIERLKAALALAVSPKAELDNHHNALTCPHCNPKGLKFAEPAAVSAQPEERELQLAQALKWWGVYDWDSMIAKVKRLMQLECRAVTGDSPADDPNSPTWVDEHRENAGERPAPDFSPQPEEQRHDHRSPGYVVGDYEE